MNRLRKIVFVAGSSELVLPITPEAFEVGHGIKIETINIHGVGDIRVAGHTTLDNINISSFFPANSYPFAVAQFEEPWDLVRQFKAWSYAQAVLRFIVTGTDINLPVLVEHISYGERDGSNDVYYTLNLAEYRYVSTGYSAGATEQAVTRAVTAQPAIPKTHTVLAGDTLSAIARKYYGESSKYTQIAAANGISNPNLIRVGAVLELPGL